MTVDSSDPTISIPIGITIGLLASFIQSLGLTIQRKSHVLNQALPEQQQKVEHRRPLWLLGFAIFLSSNLFGSLVQIASLPVVILAPLGAVSLLWNAFFARLLLGDVFSPWMILGTLLIAGGAILIAVFGIVPEPTHSIEDLLRLFDRPAFIAYFSLLGFVVLVWLATAHAVEYYYYRRYKPVDISPPLSPLLVPYAAPSILTTATTANHALDPTSPTERTPLIDRKPQPRSKTPSPSPPGSVVSMIASPLSYASRSPRTPLFLAASYASISGIISGMCLIFAKSGVELLLLTLGGDNQFWRWQAWVLLLSLIVFALLQLWYMHKGLILADPTLVCPLAFCFYNLSSIVNGLIYFDQFSLLSTTHLLLVLLGIVVLLAGVYVISFPPEGGRGVDIGTWTEEESATELVNTGEESDIEAQDVEIYEDEPLPMGNEERPGSPRGRTQTHGLGLQVITEPPAPIVAPQLSPRPPSPSPRSCVRSPLSSRGHGRQQTDSALLTSTSRHSRSSYTASTGGPAGGDATATSDAHASPGTAARRRRRTTLEPGSSLSPNAQHPLSPSASALGGFSIGLSPISPGFSIVPRERRRRPSALPAVGSGLANSVHGGYGAADVPASPTPLPRGAGGDGANGGDAQTALGAGARRVPFGVGWRMRRVVSEGDAEGQRRGHAAAPAGQIEGLPEGTDRDLEWDAERGGAGTAQEEEQGSGGAGRRAKARWKWLQTVAERVVGGGGQDSG
ncbi:hypothetical protein BD311DRAFT_860795 [Dichomitus squalens]|uniref:Magnesium transporter NIPA-domain-containing protein n=1 Tax=Dichomitus squalens TaxID=114155 RepID=A0A4Q9N7R7_9APHY|nr:hypothetical protein BD311DRAFT_860795 [Dichomitus squalens]